MLPASSLTIPPNSQGGVSVSQEIRVVNSMQGEKNIMLKLKIGYTQGGVVVSVCERERERECLCVRERERGRVCLCLLLC